MSGCVYCGKPLPVGTAGTLGICPHGDACPGCCLNAAETQIADHNAKRGRFEIVQ